MSCRKRGVEQPLGRDEEETIAPCEHLLFGPAQFVGSHAAVECRRWIAAFAQPVDLILHQRDERRDDDVGALRQFRRHLVAERFAAARRHHDERVALLESGFNRLLLQRTQLGISPVTADCGEDVAYREVVRCGHLPVNTIGRSIRLANTWIEH